jgi:6-phosphogluconolactonase
MTIVQFEAREDAYDEAAERVAEIGAEAIRDRGRFLVALSGGDTPRPLLERLASPAYAKRLDWSVVDVFWADERCVAPTDERSNHRTARVALLDHVPIPADRVHRIAGEIDPLAAADAYELTLREALGKEGRLDLILLGIGVDGHTASLFPRHQALTETGRWVVPVHAPADPPWRVTMTLPLINAARHVLFLVIGSEKAAAVRDLQKGEPLPASMVQPADGSLTVLVDAEAASLLEG